jgi:hypothetical protein
MAGLKFLLDKRGGLEAYPSLYFKLGLLWLVHILLLAPSDADQTSGPTLLDALS